MRDESHPAPKFSAVLCRGLIEASIRTHWLLSARQFSAVLCRGLIEAYVSVTLYHLTTPFSAVLCRGLIEAPILAVTRDRKLLVFRGFMPRPH